MTGNAAGGPEEFLARVHTSIPALAENGFQLVQSRCAPAPSTDAFADFQSADLSLRVVRDRGLYSLDVGPLRDAGARVELYWLLQVIGAEEDAEVHVKKGRKSLEVSGALLEKHFTSIQDRFSPEAYPATREQVQALQRKSAKERFGFGSG